MGIGNARSVMSSSTHNPNTGLEKAIRLLRRKIPEPARPKARPQKTWKTLEEGRELSLLEPAFLMGQHYPAGSTFTVRRPTNLGVELEPIGGGGCLSWQREWKSHFKKVPKRRKKQSA